MAIAFACLALLAPLAGRADAGTGDYPSPLYLSGGSSSLVPSSYMLLGTAGPGPLGAPTATVNPGGSITAPASYTYVYTVVDGGGESAASGVSNTVTTSAGNQQVTVSGLPTGATVRVYRRRSSLYNRVVELVDNSSPTYVDTTADPPSSIALPQSQNRAKLGFGCTVASPCVGYADFSPGAFMPVSGDTTLTASASTAPNGKGWMVDGPGNVAFAAGSWTFNVQIKSNGNGNGEAHLVVGMWKVKTAAGSIDASTLLIDPNSAAAENTTNLRTSTSTVQTIVHSIDLPSFSLAADEQLYVQFWRRQTVAYTAGSADGRTLTLLAHDGVAQLMHPTVSTLPDTPTLAAPAEGEFSPSTTPELSGTFSDPDVSDTGALQFRVCTALAGGAGSDCADEVATGSSGTVANGAVASWTVSPALAPGVHYWQARASDGIGTSGWSATRALTVNSPASASTLVSPAPGAQVRTATPRLKASFIDPDGDDGVVHFRVCRTASAAGQQCSPVVVAGSSSTVAGGTTASWLVSSQLPDGRYHWQAQSEDEHGEVSAWTATRRLDVAKHLIRILSEDRLVCSVGARLPARIKLAARASVTVLFHRGERVDLVHAYGKLDAGKTTLRKFLSYDLARPAVYSVQWRAERNGERESDWMRLKLKPLPPSAVPYCRPSS